MSWNKTLPCSRLRTVIIISASGSLGKPSYVGDTSSVLDLHTGPCSSCIANEGTFSDEGQDGHSQHQRRLRLSRKRSDPNTLPSPLFSPW